MNRNCLRMGRTAGRSPRYARALSWGSLVSTLLLAVAWAVPGDLDHAFGFAGSVINPMGASHDVAQAIALQPDGKILQAGGVASGGSFYLGVARYLADGSLDPAFGVGGRVRESVPFVASAITLQPDGKIVLAGYLQDVSIDFAVARLNANGTLDPSFAGDGVVSIPIAGRAGYGRAVLVQPDGRIVAAGSAFIDSDAEVVMARYNANGSPDTSFGGNGVVWSEGSPGYNTATCIARQADGKLLLGGSALGSLALRRYTPDGALDPTLDGDGIALTSYGYFAEALGLALQPDGRIILGGYYEPTDIDDPHAALARYLPDGSPDTSFDGDGAVSGRAGDWRAVAVQPSGKILFAGTVFDGEFKMAMIRFNADGSPDSPLSRDGTVPGVATSIALQPDGKWLLGGTTYPPSTRTQDFTVVRFLENSDITPPICMVGSVVSGDEGGPVVYVPLTLADVGSGVAAVQLTARSSNCVLKAPDGRTVSPGGTLTFDPAVRSVLLRAYKVNLSQSARVEVGARDAVGNSVLCDPVVANLEIPRGKHLARTFKGIPAAERYVSLQNGTPGLVEFRLWANGRLVTRSRVTDGQTVNLDLAGWLRGKQNTVRITASGPVGGTAILTISDVPGAGVERTLPPGVSSLRPGLNLEFAP